MATSTNNKMMTNPQSKNIILREAVSLDAPPLDFSYKNIKDLSGTNIKKSLNILHLIFP